MSREWFPQPGDVAMTRYGRAFYSGDEDRGSWTFDDGSGGFGPNFAPLTPDKPRGTRPLAVIDPEDREAVERLLADFVRAVDASDVPAHPQGWSVPSMQAALREYANPSEPKPDEPLGLGAVVEIIERDISFRWTRARSHDHGLNWREEYGGRWSTYADLDVVRILSEGVTEDGAR